MAKPTAKLAWNGPPIVLLEWRDGKLVYLGAFQESAATAAQYQLEAIKKAAQASGIASESRAFHINDIKEDLRSWLEEKGQSKDQISDHLARLGQTMALV